MEITLLGLFNKEFILKHWEHSGHPLKSSSMYIHPLKEYKEAVTPSQFDSTLPQDSLTLIDQSGSDKHVAPFLKPNLEAFENPERIEMTLQYLKETKSLEGIRIFKTAQATKEDALLVHKPYLVQSVELMSELGGGVLGEAAWASEDLWSSAMHALGGALLAGELVSSNACRHSFALVRPPGHHATTSSSMGLCFFNNVAIAVRNIQAENGIKKVSILDIDDHFGNGTSEIFYEDSNVQFISIHEYDFISYGIGHYREVGHGNGYGTNINIPLHMESPDSSYQAAIDKIVVPAIEGFNPDVIAVSAGFDAHFADPIGEMAIDSRTYWYIASMVERLVDSCDMKGSFWVLEGGYNPLTLGPCVRATLEGLQSKPCPELEDQEPRDEEEDVVKFNRKIIKKILSTVSPFF
jgi:acetoin utilization deacetylase AcuC-like enzyme